MCNLFRTVAGLLALVGLYSLAPAGNLPEVHTYTREFGPYILHAGKLGQMPAGHEEISFPRAIWLLSYESELLDEKGADLPDNLHCHTMLQKFLPYPMANRSLDGRPFKGMFTDGYNTELRAPEGFGVPYAPNESIRMTPMFNNREKSSFQTTMRVTLRYIYAEELQEPLKPLYGTILSVANPHAYQVPSGIDVRDRKFQFPYAGRIHAMGTHIHPYGKSVELFNETLGEKVWDAAGQRGTDGILVSMPQYQNQAGYEFKPGETYRLRVTYDNPTDQSQDAMGGLFFLFSTADGKPPAIDGAIEGEEEIHSHH